MYAVVIGMRKLAPSQARVALGVLASAGTPADGLRGPVSEESAARPRGAAGAGPDARPGAAGARQPPARGWGPGTAGGGPGAGAAGTGPSSLLNLSGGAEPVAHMHKLTAIRN